MRFAVAHKTTSYLMVLSAFFAIALGGELAAPQLVAVFLGIVGSWWWEPPRVRFERWGRAWTGLSIAVFSLSLVSFLGGGEILLVGAYFLLYLLVAKLFNRRGNRDYLQIYILAFLMLVAGTVLNAGFTYGVFFLGFVVFSTWALILFHLRREMEDNFMLAHASSSASERAQVQRILNSRRIVGTRFLVGTSLMSIVVFVSASLLFLAIPRVGLGLFFPKRRSGVTLAGFDDGVRLGEHGRIKNDPTVVMRVYIDPAYAGRGAPSIHWRGVAFDRYIDGNWERSARAPRTEAEPDYAGGTTFVHVKYDDFGMTQREMKQRVKDGIRQEIYLEPMGNDVLFGASMPSSFAFESHHPRERVAYNDEVRHPHGAGLKYQVYSSIDPPPASVLRAASEILPRLPPFMGSNDHSARSYDAYLQTPADLPTRVHELATQLTEGATTWYDKADRIERYLRANIEYTLEMRSPPKGQDPIDFFLFDRRAGHCEYFSSAMTILLRTLGVPARSVNGFLGGAWNEYGEYIAVRSGDAHSWVEVYFPGHGWVTFDPTPPGARDQLGRGGTGIAEKLERFMDTLRLKWFQWVIEYDLQRQMSLFKSLREAMSGGGSMKKSVGSAREFLARNKLPIGAGVGVALALGLALGNLRRRRRVLEPLGLTGPITRSQSQMAELYLMAEKKMAKRGVPRARSATPREYAQALGRARTPGHLAFLAIADLYYRAIYGRDESGALLERARGLREQMDQAWKASRRRAG